MKLFSFANQLDKDYSADALPPIEKWNPDFCGSLDIFIDNEGRWFYMNSPIGRAKIVRLFSTLLLLDKDGEYYLITPAEKILIKVADVPFIITNWEYDANKGIYNLYTLTADKIELGEEHKFEFGISASKNPEFAQIPYVKVRNNLYARLNRSVYYQLLNQAEEVSTQKGLALKLTSGGAHMQIGFLEANSS